MNPISDISPQLRALPEIPCQCDNCRIRRAYGQTEIMPGINPYLFRCLVSKPICPACEDGHHSDPLCDAAVAERIVKCGCPCHGGAHEVRVYGHGISEVIYGR